MKKGFIFSFIFVACVLVGCSKSEERTINSLQQSGLKGPVKRVETRTYEASVRFGEIEKGEPTHVLNIYSSFPICANSISEFNEDGNTTKVTIKDERENIFQMYKVEYFQNYEIGYYMYEADGELSYSRKYIIDNENPVGLEYYSPFSQYDSILCTFDGFLLLKTAYYRDGKIEQEVENTYKNGLPASSVSYQPQSETGYYSDWTRNDAGMVTHYRFRDDKEDLTVEDMSYDNNLITRYTRINSWEGKVDYTMEYLTFDEQGNWLSRVIFQNNQPLYLQERTIEYYK